MPYPRKITPTMLAMLDLGYEFDENGELRPGTKATKEDIVITPTQPTIQTLPKQEIKFYKEGKQDDGSYNLPEVTVTAEQPKSYMGIPTHVYSSPLSRRMYEDRNKAGRDIALLGAVTLAAPAVFNPATATAVGEFLLNPGGTVDKAALRFFPKLVTEYSKPIFGASTTPGMLANTGLSSLFASEAILRLGKGNINLSEYPGLALGLMPLFAFPAKGFTALTNQLMRDKMALMLGRIPYVRDENVEEAYKTMLDFRRNLTNENYNKLKRTIGGIDSRDYVIKTILELSDNPTTENKAILYNREFPNLASVDGTELKNYHRMLKENLTDEYINNEIGKINELMAQLEETDKGPYTTVLYNGKPYTYGGLENEKNYLSDYATMRDNSEDFTNKAYDILGFDEQSSDHFGREFLEFINDEYKPGRILGFRKHRPGDAGSLSTSSAPIYFKHTLKGLRPDRKGVQKVEKIIPTDYFELNGLGRKWYMAGKRPVEDVNGSHRNKWLSDEEYVDKVLKPYIEQFRKIGYDLLMPSVKGEKILVPYYDIVFKKKGGRLVNRFKK